MAPTLVPVLGVLLCVTSLPVLAQFPTLGAFEMGNGVGAGFGGFGGGHDPSANTPQALTCSAELDDGRQLKVTVRESESGHGGMYDSSHLPLSPLFGAFAGAGGGWGMMAQAGLDIDIQLRLLQDIPMVSFAFTQFAPTSPASCPSDIFGQILSPSGHTGLGHAGMGTMLSPMHGAMSPMHGGVFPSHARGGLVPDSSIPGIVAKTEVTAGTSQTIKVTKVQGFRLQQLAGRGLIVCDSVSYGWMWEPVCNTLVMDICCGLTYSNAGSSVELPPGNFPPPGGLFGGLPPGGLGGGLPPGGLGGGLPF